MEITMEQELGNENSKSNIKNHQSITFGSAEDMYDYLRNNGDLYCPGEMLYVFEYGASGSLAVYNITTDEAEDLARECAESAFEEYWGGFLGPGGRIYDTPEDYGNEHGDNFALGFCKTYYKLEWYDTVDYSALVLDEKNYKKAWLEFKIGTGILNGLDDDAYDFYYEAMHDYDFALGDADRWAWLNTLFGYKIGIGPASEIIDWYYENGNDVTELCAKDMNSLQMVCKMELDLDMDFSLWNVDSEPQAIRYVF